MLHCVDAQLVAEVSRQALKSIFKRQACTLKIGPTGCPQMSVTNYQPTPRNIPEQQKPQSTVRYNYKTHYYDILYTSLTHFEPSFIFKGFLITNC
jgi:hypothetical protein